MRPSKPPTPTRKPLLTGAAPLALLAIAVVIAFRTPLLARINRVLSPRVSIADRLHQFGPAARARLAPHLARAGIDYPSHPPARIILVAFKREKRLEVHAAANQADPPSFITAYPILAASGGPGPKLAEGDRQVPEGLYHIESLNPNSLYHVSLRVNYPSAVDRAQAAIDARANLGGDIMIHGSNLSVGCLAMGNPAAEDLFTLAADLGQSALDAGLLELWLAPADLRTTDLHDDRPWVRQRYTELKQRLATLQR